MADRAKHRRDRTERETIRRTVEPGDPGRFGGSDPYRHQADHRFYGYDDDRERGPGRGSGHGGGSADQSRDEGDRGWRYSRQGYGPEDYAGRGVSGDAARSVTRWFGGEDTGQIRPQDHVQARDQRGGGPQSYRRSDERIHKDTADRLSDDSWLDAAGIEIQVENGEVTLEGMVDSRTARRRAEDIAESIPGVTHVQNNLRIRRQWSDWPSADARGT